MKINNNSNDQLIKKVAYKSPALAMSAIDIKILKTLSKEDPNKKKKFLEETNKKRVTIREYYENEQYNDLSKIRVKSFKKLIGLLISLKNILKQKYPNKEGNILICMIRDLNVNDIPEDVIELLNISKRSLYDYLSTLKMILDYSTY